MRLTRLLGAALGTGFLFLAASSGAMAYDHWDREREREHWRHEHWRHAHWRHEHWRHERPMVVERERPVFIQPQPQPQPMYMAPMIPQGPQVLNFTIPLR
jgi:hypothetical protein